MHRPVNGYVQDTPQLIDLDDGEYIVVNDNRDLLDQNQAGNVIDVDGDDLAVWSAHFGNTLILTDILS